MFNQYVYKQVEIKKQPLQQEFFFQYVFSNTSTMNTYILVL
jgi:hypothetical protein